VWIVFWDCEVTQLDQYMLTTTNEFREATEKVMKHSLEKGEFCRQSIAKNGCDVRLISKTKQISE